MRDPEALRAAFAYHPPYYHFDEHATNYVDYGPQNSRGFRALKVWLALKQVGAAGYRHMIADDIRLSRAMADAVARHASCELVTQDLSITTFRYVPPRSSRAASETRRSNGTSMRSTASCSIGCSAAARRFVSNAVIGGRYVLRACIVNFHTTLADVEAVVEVAARVGRQVDSELRPAMA